MAESRDERIARVAEETVKEWIDGTVSLRRVIAAALRREGEELEAQIAAMRPVVEAAVRLSTFDATTMELMEAVRAYQEAQEAQNG